MARRTKVLSILLAISVSLFIIQVFISIKRDMSTNLRQLHVNSTPIRTSVHSTRKYVDTLIKTNQSNPVNASHLNHHHEGHDGFALSEFVHKTCLTNSGGQRSGLMNELFAAPSKRIMYCPVEKIATTYWRRFFYMILKGDKKFENPYDVSIKTALDESKLFRKHVKSQMEAKSFFDHSFSFLFVRNPYSRLLSAFVDKLLAPNPYYWKRFGVKAIKSYRQNVPRLFDGHDVTFAEFVRYVTNGEKTKKDLDVHFMSIVKTCRPCEYKYNYIGRMESFQRDSVFLMEKVGINTSVNSIKTESHELSMDDAILDSIHSPFSWKKDILKSITWEKALQRIWLKLQMRGIISLNKKLELSRHNIDMSVEKFIDLARTAHRESDINDLKRAKDIAKREAFASVPVDVIKDFRDVFIDDFRFFGYDDSPSYIFDRKDNMEFVLFNYTHLN